MNKSLMISTLLMATLLSGCQDSETKLTNVETNFSVTGSGQEALAMSTSEKLWSLIFPSAVALTPPLMEDASGARVDLTDAWIVLKKIQFKSLAEATSDEDQDQSAHYKGPFFVNLLSDEPAPFGEISLPEKGLRRVKMLLHKSQSLPSDVPSALAGMSIFLKGQVNTHQFIYRADDTTDFEVSGARAIVPEKGKDLMMVIRLAEMVKKIDLSVITSDTTISSTNRVPATNPCPEIHGSANDLYSCFRMGLNQEAKFGKDYSDKDLDSADETVAD